MSDRDTQFAGFAKALYEELARNVASSQRDLSEIAAFTQEQERLIAVRAYDLACHVCNKVTGHAEHVQGVSDLPTLPAVAHFVIRTDSQILEKSDAEHAATLLLEEPNSLLVRLTHSNAHYEGRVRRYIPKETP